MLALGVFLDRLVRVNQELVYTARQIEALRDMLVRWFDSHERLNVADLRGLTGASRKYAVPLLEFADRVGWTVRVGDERRRGARLPAARSSCKAASAATASSIC